jgi:hypothetical protein
MTFDYITDEKLRNILTRDFDELTKCIEIKASKSVLILSGSIVESVLVEFFTNFPPTGVDAKKILRSELAELLDLAFEHKLISQPTKELSTVIKNYRNLIHPGREIRKEAKFDYDTALVAKSLLNIILKEVKENYLNKIGYTATEIISKLEHDSITQPVFEKILTKIHKNEKEKLYNFLIEYDLSGIPYESQLSNPKKYINIIKTQIDREIVIKQLNKLVKKVETGEKNEVMAFFHLMHDDLDLIDEGNIELIIIYVLNVLTEASKNEDMTAFYYSKSLYSIFGKYLITEPIKKEFLNLMCHIVENFSKKDYIYFGAYDQLINSTPTDNREKIKEYVLLNTHSYYSDNFFKGYNDGDYFAF